MWEILKMKDKILYWVNLNIIGDKDINWLFFLNLDKRFQNNYIIIGLLDILVEIE